MPFFMLFGFGLKEANVGLTTIDLGYWLGGGLSS